MSVYETVEKLRMRTHNRKRMMTFLFQILDSDVAVSQGKHCTETWKVPTETTANLFKEDELMQV